MSYLRFRVHVRPFDIRLSLPDFLGVMISWSVHVAADIRCLFFFVDKVSLYMYICMSTYIYVTRHILFTHPAIDGHLGCSLGLAVVNTAAVNLGCVRHFGLEFCLDICPGVGFSSPPVPHLPSVQPLFPYPVTPTCSPAGAQILCP